MSTITPEVRTAKKMIKKAFSVLTIPQLLRMKFHIEKNTPIATNTWNDHGSFCPASLAANKRLTKNWQTTELAHRIYDKFNDKVDSFQNWLTKAGSTHTRSAIREYLQARGIL